MVNLLARTFKGRPAKYRSKNWRGFYIKVVFKDNIERSQGEILCKFFKDLALG